MNKNAIRRIEEYIKQQCENTAGISVGIVDKDKIVYENYFGYIDSKHTHNSPSAKMMIGSNTKMITAIAILQLYEKELIDLDTDISEYIIELNIQSRFPKSVISIRNILMHRSGLASDDLKFITSKDTNLEEIIQIANKTPLSTQPNTTYAYSNIGYGLLGVIIQRVSDLSYEEYVTKNILQPLNIEFEFISNDSKRIDEDINISQSFNNDLEVVKDPLNTIISAGTNTYSTLRDFTKLLNVFINPSKQTILKENSILSMIKKPHFTDIIDGEMMHSLGLVHQLYNYDNEEIGEIISHGGDTIYHHSRFVFIPKLNAGFTVMTNTENGLAISMSIVSKMMEEYFQYMNIELKPIDITESEIQNDNTVDIEGVYEGPENTFILDKKQDGLYVTIQGLELKLQLRKDNCYKPIPIGVAASPQFSGMFDNLLFQIKEINGRTILFGKSYQGFKFNSAKIAMKVTNIDSSNYTHVFGNYKLVEENILSSNIIHDVSISRSGQQMKLRMTTFGQIQVFNLEEITLNKLEIIGFNRFSGDTITTSTMNNEVYIDLLGFRFIKT